MLIALNHIAHGHQYLLVSVKSKLAVGFNGELTLREQQVLQLLSQGLDNRRIAAKLNVSPATIKKHRENILSKLNVPNTSAAVSMGLRKRIIDVGGR